MLSPSAHDRRVPALSRSIVLPLAVALLSGPTSDLQPELRTFLTSQLRFSPSDLTDLEQGKVVKHGLGASAPGEVAAVGAVRIKARKEVLIEQYRNIAEFKRGPNVLQIGRVSALPVLADLDTLAIDKQDLDLRTCRVGDCGIRLPATTIVRFQKEIDWKARDADERAHALFKQVLFEHVSAYVSGGLGRITEYDDEKRPVRPVDEFAGLLKASPYLDEIVPGLSGHLLAFPLSPLPDGEDFLYWSKEAFGLTPFITVTHVTITRDGHGNDVIASRDVYSSRYIDASLTLTIAGDAVSGPDAFYLVYMNRSRADGLKGAFASLRRSIAERRVRNSLEENLRNVKARLERPLVVK